VVYLSTGTARTRIVAAGDTLHSVGQLDTEGLTSDATLAMRELPAIFSNVKLLAAQLTTASSTLGALGIERGGPEVARLQARLARLMERAKGSNGTIGRVMSGDLAARARVAMARVDSMRALVGSERSSFGRFRRDSTLKHELTAARDELAIVRRLAAEPTGTVGRARTDSALRQSVDAAIAQLDALLTDLRKHPLRYIVF
jgi:hypothetical protein